MKKIIYFFSALALMAGFTACEKPNNDGPNFDDIVLDGFYVYGEATGTNEILATNGMAAGNNEAAEGKPVRVGMYEKYIWLEANKDFSLVENSAGNKIFYGANLTEVNYGYDPEDPECKNFGDNPNMKIQQGVLIIGEDAPKMQVKETGLYHIVLDNNTLGDLDFPQIIVQKADWGVRGGMNGWGFTKGEATKNEDGTITYTWVDQDLAANGEFKFASCHGWKINLDVDGVVKAEVGLGLTDGKMSHTGGNIIAGEKAGLYTITLTYKKSAGAIADSFSYTCTLTKESTLPEACYLIGEGIKGWTFPGDAVAMIPAHSEPGCFWAIRYIEAEKGFKFSEINTDWGKDFTGRTTNTGYTVKDNNCYVAENGLYMLEVDYKNGVVTVSKAMIYGMGDAFGGWNEGANAFTVSGDKFTATTAAAGELRMYAGSTFAAATGNWWHREFNVFDGKIEYRAGGGDQEKVNATGAGQTVTLDFNAGTGSIQ
jgi:hypothetical protein